MSKIKVNDIYNIMSDKFGDPKLFNKIKRECDIALKDIEILDSEDYSNSWKNVFELLHKLNESNLTIEQYEELENKPKRTRGKANKVSPEELLAIDCWTNKLYNEAYDIVKDRLYPVVIPTYNRPQCNFLKWVTEIVQKGYEWPIYLVVRKSQKEMYENSEYVKFFDYIHVKAFPDEMIDDIGKVREQIVNAFSKQYECIFMFDDDITNFSHSVPWVRSNGEPKAQSVKSNNFGKTMAMWQIAMEYAIKKYDVFSSTGMMQGFSWVPDFINVESSIRILSGLPTLAVCINLRKLKELNLNYRTIIGNGHDDLDLLIRCLQKGALTAEFRWMTYSSPGIGTDILNFNTVEERFAIQQEEMYKNYKDVPFVKFYTPRGLPNVGIYWNKLLDFYKDNGFGDWKDQRYQDLWRNGKLLEEAKNNYEGV